jgi:dissimilatory sulfite reductase related protein
MITNTAANRTQFDEHGLLTDPQSWNELLAQEIADRYDIGVLREQHWQVIRALREHYARYGAAPAMVQICRAHERDRHWVHDLFHSCLNAWRVAGLPDPGEEAKSYLSGT